MADEKDPPEKTTSWSEEELNPETPPVPIEAWAPPEWALAFQPGAIIYHAGWRARVLGMVRAQDGSAAVLVLPEDLTAKAKKRLGH